MENIKCEADKGRSEAWLKAAVLGGLWASFEIIAGSLLHNLHIPFSGTAMSFFSVVLMVSFLQVWDTRGVIWRAGLIAGLMKSLSPSAVILGPMIGIFTEALIVEVVILLTGRHLLGYLLAGIGALMSTILHKLISLFILYGKDLVRIYLNLFSFLERQSGLNSLGPRELILLILAVYTLLGLLAALFGILIGRRADRLPSDLEIHPPDPEAGGEDWNQVAPGQRFRSTLLVLHLISIPVLLLLIGRFGLKIPGLLPVALYTAFLLGYYPRIIRRLTKPFFWIQLVLLVLVAGFFWDTPGSVHRYLEGLLVGMEMALRALVVVSTFSAISVEIRNPVIVDRLLGLGLGNAYEALSMAFRSLPVMLDRSPSLKNLFIRPVASVSVLIHEANAWIRFHRRNQEK